MKVKLEVDGQPYSLLLQGNGDGSHYTLDGVQHDSGEASILEVMPGVFSVLLDSKSFIVHVVENPVAGNLEVCVGTDRHRVSVGDARDRSRKGRGVATAGPLEIRAQMPGKVVKLLVDIGHTVHTGQGLIVVEAMKMQNEMKSPKDGVITKIISGEGATVTAGETLMVVH